MFKHYQDELIDDTDHDSFDAFVASLQVAAERAASMADEHDDMGRA